jgi:hypothetical protein
VSSRREGDGQVRVIGEITNLSGRSFESASFTLNVYDPNGRLVDSETIIKLNFAEGHTKSFVVYVETMPRGSELRIDFDFGF